ncbi:transglutaminase-like domain-containing protein [Alteromonas gilva]|uniref:Transglutaminase-like domain-containing protein n=1 Tax=Alteromonas gilva TaxID=2987522 RepID=A0ABT5KY07_9ALTE|nr:transglutaminase-like domain-containing protein [Alteromonas gilva]MDC8829664.1 transglutaminase-like domain-containing protein [Alteromonas gilva]
MKVVLAILLLVLSCSTRAQSVPTLAQIPVTLNAPDYQPLGDIIHFELTVQNAAVAMAKLQDYAGISATQLSPTRLAIAMGKQPQFSGSRQPQYRLSSFVIDIDESATQAFINGFKPQRDAGLQAIPAYVNEYINEPTYIHGFNFASVVASQRAGDCTEYAVLTTALARALGLDARLILGTVIMDENEQVGAFGHAWTEVWYQGKWQLIDAALYTTDINSRYYLPSSSLENEGPGFGLALMTATKSFPLQVNQLQSLR